MSHYVFAPYYAWGHAKPTLSFALNLAQLFPDLYITLVVSSSSHTPLLNEQARHGPSDSVATRVKLVPLGPPVPDGSNDWQAICQGVMDALPEFLAGLVSGEVSDPFQAAPKLLVGDLLLAEIPDIVRQAATTGPKTYAVPKMFALSPCPASWSYLRATSKAPKRFQDLLDGPTAKDKTRNELLQEAYTFTNGTLVTAGLPVPMFDYELQPQMGAIPFDPEITYAVRHAATQHHKWDGLVMTTSPDLEPGANETLSAHLGGTCLQVGPQFPDRFWLNTPNDNSPVLNQHDREVINFLDQAQDKFGTKSVMFISFGTFYSPSKRPDLLETLVTSLLSADPPLPFLFATATTHDLLSSSIKEQVAKSEGRGMICKFAPQQRILQHPATGWFLTHAGSGSLQEAILNKVPMVIWPCMTDQPIMAAVLTLLHRVAFELIQVRTGPSTGRPTARGVLHLGGSVQSILDEMSDVWAKMRSEEGKQVRERMEGLFEVLKESWKEGKAKMAMEGMGKFM